MDVEVLANAFQIDRAVLLGNIYPVDSFDVYDDEGNKYFSVIDYSNLNNIDEIYSYAASETDVVELYDNADGSLVETFHIVVFGDLNGDSHVNGLDVSIATDEAF